MRRDATGHVNPITGKFMNNVPEDGESAHKYSDGWEMIFGKKPVPPEPLHEKTPT